MLARWWAAPLAGRYACPVWQGVVAGAAGGVVPESAPSFQRSLTGMAGAAQCLQDVDSESLRPDSAPRKNVVNVCPLRYPAHAGASLAKGVRR